MIATEQIIGARLTQIAPYNGGFAGVKVLLDGEKFDLLFRRASEKDGGVLYCCAYGKTGSVANFTLDRSGYIESGGNPSGYPSVPQVLRGISFGEPLHWSEIAILLAPSFQIKADAFAAGSLPNIPILKTDEILRNEISAVLVGHSFKVHLDPFDLDQELDVGKNLQLSSIQAHIEGKKLTIFAFPRQGDGYFLTFLDISPIQLRLVDDSRNDILGRPGEKGSLEFHGLSDNVCYTFERIPETAT